MAVCEKFFQWLTTLEIPKRDDEGVTSGALEKILTPYAKELQDCGTYWRFLCPRAYPHGSHASDTQETNPSCVAYKTGKGFAVDFHMNASDPGFNIPPFELWYRLKYPSLDPAIDKSKYPEFCEEFGIGCLELTPAVDLILEWAKRELMPCYKLAINKVAYAIYCASREKPLLTRSEFKGYWTNEILECLLAQAQECNPPALKKPYTKDKMPVFFKTWADGAFSALLRELPTAEEADYDKLSVSVREEFIHNLRGLLTQRVNFNFKGARTYYTSSLWARALELPRDPHQWTQFESFPVWFKRESEEKILLGVRFELVEQLDHKWADALRTSERFTRQATRLKVGESQVICVTGAKMRVLVCDADSLGLELVPASGVDEQTSEDIDGGSPLGS